MEKEKLRAIRKRMLLMIPSTICFIIGDYCIGVEPADSYVVSGMVSSGFLSIADWRIAISNIGGIIGAVLYMAAALPFVGFLQNQLPSLQNKWDRRILKVYIAGLLFGCISFMYFHIACGTLIHTYNVIYDAAGGNTELALQIWGRSYMIQAASYWTSFIGLGIAVTGGWIALILRGVLPLKKAWIFAAPLMVAGIGFVLEALLPLPFDGFASGFESFGWIVMFLGGMKCVEQKLS